MSKETEIGILFRVPENDLNLGYWDILWTIPDMAEFRQEKLEELKARGYYVFPLMFQGFWEDFSEMLIALNDGKVSENVLKPLGNIMEKVLKWY